jgi:sulfopyruvate decarboxylase TPP-binding subunit
MMQESNHRLCVLLILPHRTPLNELMAQTSANGIWFNSILSVCELPRSIWR